jgi:competence ComEA-like helix-hairpin-helix protein
MNRRWLIRTALLSAGGVLAPEALALAEVKGASRADKAKATGKVNINEASRAELMTLAGVGAGTADRIIAHRTANGPFKRLQDLEKVDGVGKGVVEKNAGRLAIK